MDRKYIEQLFLKYLQNKATEEERKELFRLFSDPECAQILEEFSEKYNIEIEEDEQEVLSQEVASDIINRITGRCYKSWRKVGIRWASVAAIILVIFFVGRHYDDITQQVPQKMSGNNVVINDAAPGQIGAVLKVGNKKVVIDALKNGSIAVGFVKKGDLLQVDKNVETYATLTVPYGYEQQIQLSDGTKVWLNAGSSLYFPTKFMGKMREVTVTGEAYFEVVHDAAHPFVVKAGTQTIKDLGTSFNVNAYENEGAVRTTLVQGLVQINGKANLIPGEQYSKGKIKKVNVNDVIAWKSGYFRFNHDDIQTVIKQLERWYKVKIRFEGSIPPDKFGGAIERSLPLSSVLNMLSESGIHYTINGDEVVIHS